MQENQFMSACAIAHQIKSSSTTVQLVLQEQHLYTYRSEDDSHRLGFCQWLLGHNEADFGGIILFQMRYVSPAIVIVIIETTTLCVMKILTLCSLQDTINNFGLTCELVLTETIL